MTLRRKATQLLLRPQDLSPSREDFEVVGAFNPGAIRMGDEVILLVRVAERPKEQRSGYTGLPRWDPRDGIVVDWCPNKEWTPIDPRVHRRAEDGLIRLTFLSHLRVVRCGDGREVREIADIALRPETQVEEFGVEDPRITAMGDRFYITYVAVSRHGPATALASTKDFREFERLGIIFCPENKDVVLFPEKVRGEFAALHRPAGRTPFTRPEMWTARSPDLLHWGKHAPVLLMGMDWESGRVGAGAPPVRVNDGWLEIYHGNRHPTAPGEVGAYYGGALLLDADKPETVLRRSAEPVLSPESDFEVSGFVPNVVFPTGVVVDDDTFLIYYGAADECTALAEISQKELLATMDPVS